MRILVTGGCGFVGKHLCAELVKENKVVVLDNLSNSTEKDIPKGVEFIKGDIRNIKDVEKASAGVDLVYHLAAKISVSESVEKPELYHDVNITGTKNVFETNKDKKIIFTSSAAVYGNCKNLPVKEIETLKALSPYAETKILGEKIILQNPKNCIVRLFNIYGKGQTKEYAGVISVFLENIKKNQPLTIFGDGNQTRDFIYINDVVSALLLLKDKSGIFNIASGKETTINEVSKVFQKIKSIQVKHEKSREGDIYRSVADISKLKALGWSSKTDIEKGIKDLLL